MIKKNLQKLNKELVILMYIFNKFRHKINWNNFDKNKKSKNKKNKIKKTKKKNKDSLNKIEWKIELKIVIKYKIIKKNLNYKQKKCILNGKIRFKKEMNIINNF